VRGGRGLRGGLRTAISSGKSVRASSRRKGSNEMSQRKNLGIDRGRKGVVRGGRKKKRSGGGAEKGLDRGGGGGGENKSIK